MSRAVLDASAILAFLRGEPGSEVVDACRGRAIASAVNVAEAGARLSDLGASRAEVRRSMALMSMEIIPFDEEQAHDAADIRDATRRWGLSLGDRACLQLAARRGLPALTADRAWSEIDTARDCLPFPGPARAVLRSVAWLSMTVCGRGRSRVGPCLDCG